MGVGLRCRWETSFRRPVLHARPTLSNQEGLDEVGVQVGVGPGRVNFIWWRGKKALLERVKVVSWEKWGIRAFFLTRLSLVQAASGGRSLPVPKMRGCNHCHHPWGHWGTGEWWMCPSIALTHSSGRILAPLLCHLALEWMLGQPSGRLSLGPFSRPGIQATHTVKSSGGALPSLPAALSGPCG